MTREENLHWIDEEIRTWENECQSKHPIKEALYAARKAFKQEPTLEKDGTLVVTTEHCEKVGRVLVQCGTNGALFYQDQEPRWIPVSERLPDKDGLYLVSVKNDHLRRYSKTCWYSDNNWFARQDVVAWMSLPEPYKGGQEE